jgi:hypothetical protein
MYGWRQHHCSSSKSEFLTKKRIDSTYKMIEKIYDSSYDLIAASSDQKCAISCAMAASMLAVLLKFHPHALSYAYPLINDLYSRGIIDLEHAEGNCRKIVIAISVIIGKIQNLMGISLSPIVLGSVSEM